jgi:hypothetical protein
LINLANNPEYATVLSKMKARMNSYLAAYPEAKQKDRKGEKPGSASVQSGQLHEREDHASSVFVPGSQPNGLAGKLNQPG